MCVMKIPYVEYLDMHKNTDKAGISKGRGSVSKISATATGGLFSLIYYYDSTNTKTALNQKPFNQST